MLKLNEFWEIKESPLENLNTSHVKVKQKRLYIEQLRERDLNTSHVKVKQIRLVYTVSRCKDLNTSHVKVKPLMY